MGQAEGGRVTGSAWDTLTSGRTQSQGGTGHPTVTMKKAQTYRQAGWDLTGETANGRQDIWTLPPGDYPRLWWQ